MARPRNFIVNPDVSGVFHCFSRCVRGAFLVGRDGERDAEHRKAWIYQKLRDVADVFAVSVGAYAILGNHFHIVLKTFPEWAKGWSAEEVARRWLRLHPPKGKGGRRRAATEEDVAELAARSDYVEVLRRRLHDLSWFMKCVNEPIAKRCNAEDEVRGHFWEDRFDCEALLDELAVLTCCVYVDLNWVRAAMASTPEASTYTSAKERIDAWQADRDGAEGRLWLAPMGQGSLEDPTDRGLLSIGTEDYLRVLDLTGRVVRAEKAGAIPPDLEPLLERMGIDPARWATTMRDGGRGVGSVVGAAASRAREAIRRGGHWVVSAFRVDRTTPEAAPV